ncbi:MAG: type VII toxin-antitoxin system MntA family adenylyltransferase antitoxin [Actinomycetota bacterium]
MVADKRRLTELGVELVMIFGSRARGVHRPDSDLDVAILFGPGTSIDLAVLDAAREALGGGDELDLVCLNEADPLLLKEVALDGVPIFEYRPGTVEEFRILAYKRYMDTAKFRELEAGSLRAGPR